MKIKRTIGLLVIICIMSAMFTGLCSTVYSIDGALVAHYKFDGDTKDSSGHGNDGAGMVGNISYVDGPLGKAAVFDGKSYIEVNDSDSLDLGKEFSISVWLNDTCIPIDDFQGILCKTGNDWDNTNAYGLGEMNMLPYADRYDADYQNIGGNGKQAERRFESSKWQLLTVTYDGSVFKFYYNGEMVSQREAYDGTTVITSKGKLLIGFNKSVFYRGRMDDLRIYNRLLSQDEIKGLYNEAVAGTGKELVERPDRMIAYFNFNKDANDYSGYSNNGAALGNITYVNSIAGKGAKFNGSSYIEVKDSDSLQVDEGFTVSGWFKLDLVKQDAYYVYPIMEKLEGSTNLTLDSYWLGVDSNNHYLSGAGLRPWFSGYCFNNGDYLGGNHFSSMGESTMLPGTWAMLTFTFDGKEVKTYLNGKLINSSQLEKEDTLVHSKGKLVIGKMLSDDKNMYAKGIFDELRLYNYALDQTAVSKLLVLKDGISLNLPAGKTDVTLKAKGTFQLAPKVMTYVFTASPAMPGTGTDSYAPVAAAAPFTYKALNPKVAVVDANGKITAVAKGKASIQINCGELAGYLTVNVQ